MSFTVSKKRVWNRLFSRLLTY